MTSPRKAKLLEVMEQSKHSMQETDSAIKEWGLAHDAYNKAVTEKPAKGRRSGTDLENLRRHALGSYEMLLDLLRIHSDNLAHLHALKGLL